MPKKNSQTRPPPSFSVLIFRKNSHRSIPNAHADTLAGVFLFFSLFLSQKRTLRQLLSTHRACVDSLGSLVSRDALKPRPEAPRPLCSGPRFWSSSLPRQSYLGGAVASGPDRQIKCEWQQGKSRHFHGWRLLPSLRASL